MVKYALSYNYEVFKYADFELRDDESFLEVNNLCYFHSSDRIMNQYKSFIKIDVDLLYKINISDIKNRKVYLSYCNRNKSKYVGDKYFNHRNFDIKNIIIFSFSMYQQILNYM